MPGKLQRESGAQHPASGRGFEGGVHGAVTLDHRFLDDVRGLGSATIENLCAFIRAQLEDSVPGLCAVMIERRASGDRCVLRWTP